MIWLVEVVQAIETASEPNTMEAIRCRSSSFLLTVVQVLYYDDQQAIRAMPKTSSTSRNSLSLRTTTHLAERHVDKSECNPLCDCRHATAIESPRQSALLIIVILVLASSLLALLRPLSRLGLLLRGLCDLLGLVVLSLRGSGSGSLLALLLLGGLGGLLLRSLRDLLLLLILASVVVLFVLSLSSRSLALLSGGAVRALGVYATERSS